MPEFQMDDFSGLDLTANRSVPKPNSLRDAKNIDLTAYNTVKARDGLRHVATLHPQSVGLYTANGFLRSIVPAGSKAYKQYQPSNFLYDRVGDSSILDFPDREFDAAGDLIAGMKTLHDSLTYEVDRDNFGIPYVTVEMWNGEVQHHYLDYAKETPINEPIKSRVALGFTPAPGLVKLKEKLYAPDQLNGFVHYCAAVKPRDWATAGDAGFLAVGRNATGDRSITGLSFHNNALIVTFPDSTQVWFVDPNENVSRPIQFLNGPGTQYGKTLTNVVGDVMMFTEGGFRSLASATVENELQEGDIGSFIEPLTRLEAGRDDDPKAFWSQSRAQYLCAFNRVGGTSRVYAYKRLPLRKVTGWTYWDLPVSVDYWTELNGELYVRSGDEIYKFEPDCVKDEIGDLPQDVEWRVETQRFGDKKVGSAKRWDWFDILQSGTSKVSMLLDVNTDVQTRVATITDATLDEGWIPLMDRSQTLGMVFEGTGAWNLESFQVRYRLGRRGAR